MAFSFSNLELLDQLYQSYLADPESVEPSWRHFFAGWELGISQPGAKGGHAEAVSARLIHAYRVYGHLMASINPLSGKAPEEPRELRLETLGIKQEELALRVPTGGFLKEKEASVSELIAALKNTYCGAVGFEYMNSHTPELEQWIQKKIEPHFSSQLSIEEKQEIFQSLSRAESFETFIHTKYTGQKRFSLEGGETLIPMLTFLLEKGVEEGISEIVLGMSHRGRLNVLANIVKKPYASIFYEFEEHYLPEEGSGDVKYHKGFRGELKTKQGKAVHVTLAANPSHLESVIPVVEGHTRAKQELLGVKKVLPILIHGDAALAGQGVVYETLQLCKLEGYRTGGTIHIVMNNQIGFTTLPKDSRSTRYCTDIAAAFGAPVFHVNGEKPEECVQAILLSLEIRQKFHCDVFIDLNCYRKYGHNEGDEPAFTQPYEYQIIRAKKSIRELYQRQLEQEGVLSPQMGKAYEAELKAQLTQALKQIPKDVPGKNVGVKAEKVFPLTGTAVSTEVLSSVAQKFCSVPEGFHLHPKIQRLVQDRLTMVNADPTVSAVDWGMGEHLAFATLLVENVPIRLSGQDSQRGTFSQRHSVWIDQKQESFRYVPLARLHASQGRFESYNSPLSEFAVLGFDFGYTLSFPKALVIWEAQYGDFANEAQVIIDQYIAPSSQKWGDHSRIVLMLPHGYEGQGPEHSSARVERYLQLCGDFNMQVVNCTTPAQLFHLLRRQALQEVARPLILFTPKALLRHPECKSRLNELSQGTFEEFIDDSCPPQHMKRVLFCTGKIFYDLIAARKDFGKVSEIAIIRIEQLYPFHTLKFQGLFKKYEHVKECFWVQEEHGNMGAWDYIHPVLEEALQRKVQYVGRSRSASTAAGSYALHQQQQLRLMKEAFS